MKNTIFKYIIFFFLCMFFISILCACGSENKNESQSSVKEKETQTTKKDDTNSTEVFDPNRKEPNPNSVAYTMHLELYKHFEMKYGKYIFPDDYCGSYMAEDGYHIVLTSLSAEIVSKYNEYLSAYDIHSEYVFYEQGNLSINIMQSYADDMNQRLSDNGLVPESIEVDTSEMKIVILSDWHIYRDTLEYVKELINAGVYDKLEISDIDFRST